MMEVCSTHKQTDLCLLTFCTCKHARLTDLPFRGLWLSSCLGTGQHLYCWSVMDEMGAFKCRTEGEHGLGKHFLCPHFVPSLLWLMEKDVL